MNIKIYTTSTCFYCKKAKAYFEEHDIEYEEYDVAENLTKRQEMLDISGQMGIPVIDIDGNIIIGFDKNKIKKLIAESKN